MFWIIVIAIVIMVIIAVMRSRPTSKRRAPSVGKKYVFRNGKAREADSVFEAWTSGDLKAMLSQLDQKTTLVDRHFLLMNIVAHTYKNRDNPAMREVCYKVSQMHIVESPRIKPALKRSLGVTPRVPTFQQFPTVLTEDGRFDEAIAICQKAIQFGLHYGTKMRFEGRIERIKKKQKKTIKKKGPRTRACRLTAFPIALQGGSLCSALGVNNVRRQIHIISKSWRSFEASQYLN
jgi:hypothetical protein